MNQIQEILICIIKAREHEKSRNKLIIFSVISYLLNFIHEVDIIYTVVSLFIALLALYKNIKAHISFTKAAKEINK